MFLKKIELISNRTTIEFNQFDNIRFVVFGKFCFEETKRSHTKTKNEKLKKNWLKVFKKSFSISKYLETFFLFLYFKQKRNETKFFFRGAIKNKLFDHKKNETLTSLLLGRHYQLGQGKRMLTLTVRTWPSLTVTLVLWT